MKIFVKVKPKSKKEEINEIDKNHFVIKIKEIPQGGKANLALVKILAKYFKIPLSKVKIISGLKSKNKVLEIED